MSILPFLVLIFCLFTVDMYVGMWIEILYSHSTWLANIYYLGEDTLPHFLHHYSYLGFLYVQMGTAY